MARRVRGQAQAAAEPGGGRRARQREDTRARIVAAAVECFAERGFDGASTREIATRADTNQGLITYHFASKEALWQAAADAIFGCARAELDARLPAMEALPDARERARAFIRAFVRYAAAHPELFRLLVEEGKTRSARMTWLVDRHIAPLFEVFRTIAPAMGPADVPRQDGDVPHLFYAMAGASSILFAVVPECERLTGLDPLSGAAIERHAELVSALFVPES